MKKRHLSFSWQLFLMVATLFLAFATCFIFFQYSREKEYKIDLLNTRLQDFNNEMYLFVRDARQNTGHLPSSKELTRYTNEYISTHGLNNLRVTLISGNGTVLYDNFDANVHSMQNHLNRTEVQLALKYGSGYAINRTSHTLASNFFYSATCFKADNMFIRSALPYDVSLSKALHVDSLFIYFAIIISLLLYLLFFKYTQRMGQYITQLRHFVQKADKDEPFEPEEITTFPDNELGEISQHIVQIYKNLKTTKEELTLEREKLITHLGLSHEGLCIYDHNYKRILSNPLFAQYSNLIADNPVSTDEATLQLPEMQPVTRFLRETDNTTDHTERKFCTEIEKNGKIFAVECVTFHDGSFELSITDITQTEEQARLKRQITQNIAHELKTPVSSIQGYLETINNSDNMNEDTRQQFLSRCYAQSNRLANLLRDITVLTRMDEASQMIDNTEEVDLTLIMQNIQRETALQLEEKKMRMNNLLRNGLTVKGNSSLIYSIFRNLTDNAIAYAGEGSTITIRCYREEDNLLYFSFADNGVGVGTEHLSRLFERFYRVDKGRSRKMGGTGLGLAIVKNAVLFHGGNISAKNVQDGGLEIMFTLHR
jgi:signal transduction histidine kinase